MRHVGLPGLDAAVEVRHPTQPEPAKTGRGQTRGEAFIADHDDSAVVASRFGNAVAAGGVKAPLELVSLDHHRTGQVPIAAALLHRADVDDECARRHLNGEIGRGDPVKIPACLLHHLVDAALLHRSPLLALHTASPNAQPGSTSRQHASPTAHGCESTTGTPRPTLDKGASPPRLAARFGHRPQEIADRTMLPTRPNVNDDPRRTATRTDRHVVSERAVCYAAAPCCGREYGLNLGCDAASRLMSMGASADDLAAIRSDIDGLRASRGGYGYAVVDAGRSYLPGHSVRIEIRKRGGRYDLTDGAAAVTSPVTGGWFATASDTVAELGMNVNSRGVVFVTGFERRDLADLGVRLAECSRVVFVSLLESAD
jgi:hypothetical protein